jgi:hypothetical protein
MKLLIKNLAAMALCALALTLTGNDSFPVNGEFSTTNKWRTHVIKDAAEAGGKAAMNNGVLKVTCPSVHTVPHAIQALHPLMLKKDMEYKLSFTAKVNEEAIVELVYSTAKPPYASCWRNKIKLSPDKTQYECIINTGKSVNFDFSRESVLRIYFGGNISKHIELRSIYLSELVPFPAGNVWQVFPDAQLPEKLNTVPSFLGAAKPITVKMNDSSINIGKLTGGVREKRSAIIFYKFSSDKAGNMRLGFAADWWMEVYVNGKNILSTMTKGNGSNKFTPGDHIVEFPVQTGNNVIAARVFSGSQGWKFVCGIPLDKDEVERPGIKFVAGDEWGAVEMSDFIVKKDSALDLSSLVDAPAGRYGRVIINSQGQLTFENNPDQTIRLRGFNGVPRAIWQQKSDEEFKERAKQFAIAARRQGYRLVRLNMYECYVTSGAEKDMSFNPKYLDRWDWLLACLKEQGIYTHLVIASYGVYFSPFSFKSDIFKNRNKAKLKMYLADESVREHWRFGAEYLMAHVNPYTQIAWKDDPALVVVEHYNEQEIGIRHLPHIIKDDAKIRATLTKQWNKWLKTECPSVISELKSDPNAQVTIPAAVGGNIEISNLFTIFLNELALNSTLWCDKILRDSGYKGLTSQHNFSKQLGFSAVRHQTSQVISSNGYFCHPHNSEVNQFSSIDKLADYWRGINATRIAGRPFMVTEFNHAFWNPYQYEGGLLFGAYSALQGYSSIMVHSGPVVLEAEISALGDFTCGDSPTVRAGEFLAACLFQRRDVKEAQSETSVEINNDFLNSNNNRDAALNPEQSKLALVSRFTINFPDLNKVSGVPDKIQPANLILTPGKGGSISGSEWASNVTDSSDKSFVLKEYIDKMKSSGMIPADNLSESNKGIFQSDTGEITMYQQDKLLKLITPLTEAVATAKSDSINLGSVKSVKTSIPACVALTSMDSNPLAESKRMVLIYSTESANSGMILSHDRKKMVKKGQLPVLLRTGILKFKFRNRNAGELKLYALGFDGSRREELPVKAKDGILNISIDSSKLKHGPSVFYELSTE